MIVFFAKMSSRTCDILEPVLLAMEGVFNGFADLDIGVMLSDVYKLFSTE